ncbi:FliM/FliN family flagellar motor switch protein [Buchnera aphidicola]|uniref:Flagellar motor switch protein FliN n=1 Tax=Buchnera aphidicola (Anoecia oenotherae) TaxID=1241833 RepID=A0A4D6XQB3_9GAMM|nr:FliM/FliN family flagellar motor switch protein [Buchnera aphidicola]QCI19203.1 flagellar motor switch protein FliN [Buchnera aphidicola (Anoecia oenotherae)]
MNLKPKEIQEKPNNVVVNQLKNNTQKQKENDLTKIKTNSISEKIKKNTHIIDNILVNVTVELGTKKIKIKDILNIKKDSIISLDKSVDNLLNIFVNNCLIGQGEIVVVNNTYGIKISTIYDSLKTKQDLEKNEN